MHPKKRSITINGKAVTVEKLPLRRISEVFKALDELPKKLANVNFDSSTEEFLAVLPTVIGEVLPEVAKIIALGSSLKEDEVLDELGLADAVEVLVAIFEINELNKVVDNIKKLTARKPEAPANVPTTGSTGP